MALHLGSTYLITREYQKSLRFYRLLLQSPPAQQNATRFAVFEMDGGCIALLNAFYDVENPGATEHRGLSCPLFDDLPGIAAMENTRKCVLNLWTEDLRAEWERIRALQITDTITPLRYLCNASPYYYFHLLDPDGNMIEITGAMQAEKGTF